MCRFRRLSSQTNISKLFNNKKCLYSFFGKDVLYAEILFQSCFISLDLSLNSIKPHLLLSLRGIKSFTISFR